MTVTSLKTSAIGIYRVYIVVMNLFKEYRLSLGNNYHTLFGFLLMKTNDGRVAEENRFWSGDLAFFHNIEVVPLEDAIRLTLQKLQQ